MAISHDIPGLEPAVSEAGPRDYIALLKPRVMRLSVFTALVGMLAAPGPLGWLEGSVAILCIAVGAGASGALNMWWDADIDAAMSRTVKRPIPSGAIEPGEALGFGLVLSVFSVATLGLLVNWAAAGMLALTILFYVVVYSMWLKRSTPQNIVIGGAAGAFPPMVGWAATTGTVGWESAVLFAIIFLWTPPHFWALALFKRLDYSAASVPMLPVVKGVRHTQHQILAYSLVMAPVAVLPWPMGFAGPLYGAVSIVAGAIFLQRAWAVWRMDEGDVAMVSAKRLFLYSIAYLFALFAALGLEAVAARLGYGPTFGWVS